MIGFRRKAGQVALEGFFIEFAQLALVLTGFVSVFVIFLADRSERSAALTHHAASMLTMTFRLT